MNRDLGFLRPVARPSAARTRGPACDRCNGVATFTRVEHNQGEPDHLHWCGGCDVWFRSAPCLEPAAARAAGATVPDLVSLRLSELFASWDGLDVGSRRA